MFSAALFGDLTSYLDGKPCLELETLKQGSGLDAMRAIMGRYEPRTTQPKRAYLKNILGTRPAVEDMGAMVRDFARNIKGFADLAGKSLDEDLLVIALTEGCVPELISRRCAVMWEGVECGDTQPRSPEWVGRPKLGGGGRPGPPH